MDFGASMIAGSTLLLGVRGFISDFSPASRSTLEMDRTIYFFENLYGPTCYLGESGPYHCILKNITIYLLRGEIFFLSLLELGYSATQSKAFFDILQILTP